MGPQIFCVYVRGLSKILASAMLGIAPDGLPTLLVGGGWADWGTPKKATVLLLSKVELLAIFYDQLNKITENVQKCIQLTELSICLVGKKAVCSCLAS